VGGSVARELDLAAKAVGPECGSQLRAEDLDGNSPLVLPILCEENGRHPPAAELALDGVVARERGDDSGHEWVADRAMRLCFIVGSGSGA
jgi:hypothetical protein